MDRNANKIVIVTQKSHLQELLYKYNTKAQAKFYIEHMGADFSDYILEDETYQKALANVKQIADKLAVNDFFIGPKSHTSARYDLTTRHTLGRVITESQSSSGIIVSTGIGQTGWYKSVMAQAKAACGLFGYDGSGDYEKIGWDSLTMIFFRDGNPKYIHSPGKYRENRSVVCKEDDLLICGSHFPCESDEVFLNHMENFVTDYLNDDFLLVGDLNANDQTRGNKKMINRLLDKGAVDLWVMFGNDENTPTEAQYQGRLDYAIASPSLAKKVKNIEIDPFLMNAGVTDHAAIIVDINE